MSAIIMSRAAFARLLGCNKSTVTRWAEAGRLVLDDKGHVLVEASQQRLAITRGGRTDVEARHAAERGAALSGYTAGDDLGTAGRDSRHVADSAGRGLPDATGSATDRAPAAGSRSQYKAAVLQFENAAIKLEMALRRGLRLDRAAALREGHALGATVRAAFERLIDQTAPRLAVMESDADRRRVLDAEIRRLRHAIRRELPRALRRLRKAGEQRKAA